MENKKMIVFIVFLYGGIRTSNGNQVQNSTNLDVNIFDNSDMPLVAKLDIASVNKNIKGYIDNRMAELNVEDRLDKLERSVKELKLIDKREGTVAFSAYMSKTMADRSDSLTAGSRVVFDQVLTNEKGAYNSVSGGFLPPSTGLYAFTYTLCSDARFSDKSATGTLRYGDFGTKLMDGSSIIAILHVDTETRLNDDCSSAFVIYDVKTITNEIYVEVSSYAHQGKLLSTESQTRSTFTGWKLS